MKIFFSCSTGDLLKHKEDYTVIVDTVKKEGHTLTRDWLEKSIEHTEQSSGKSDRSNRYSKVMLAIAQADAVIFDCTVRSMGIGHQLTYALDKSKPTLLLYKRVSKEAEDLFISGSKSGFLTIKDYKTQEEAQKLVRDFLLKNLSKPKVRFQLVMDKEQNDFIEWASYKYKRNKSEIIKSAIDKMAGEDKDYSRS